MSAVMDSCMQHVRRVSLVCINIPQHHHILSDSFDLDIRQET